MDVEILGSCSVQESGMPISMPPLCRQLICALAVADGPLRSSMLMELLWDDINRISSLTSVVHKTRRLLPDRLVKDDVGYRLRLDPVADTLDLAAFRDRVAHARVVTSTDSRRAAQLYQEAVALWGDPPLQDFPGTSAMQRWAEHLLAEFQDALTSLAEIRLTLGEHHQVIPLLRRCLEADPYNEHLRKLLMIALYRDGLKADALLVYEEARRSLTDQTGLQVEPGLPLRRVQMLVVNDDPALRSHPFATTDPAANIKKVIETAARTRSSSVTSDSSGNNASSSAASKIDTSRPQVARIWNYWLGGRDNFKADRDVGDEVAEIFPEIRDMARECRGFLSRAVTYLAAKEGVRQFLDIGTGLPTANNTHEVAQRVAPECKIVYVDNDPLVLVHARALLTSTTEGITAYIDADLRDPDKILETAAQKLDFSKPIALMLLGVVEMITDDEQARSIVNLLTHALPSGSFLVLDDATSIIHGTKHQDVMELWMERGGAPIVCRTSEQITRFFDGLQLLDPGVVSVSRWRPDPNTAGLPEEVDAFGGVAKRI